jgi:hypothetical protein
VSKGGVEDAAWLQKELSADLDKFLDARRNLKKPEYYIAITNVRLSSLHSGSIGRKGGQEKIEDLFESYKSKLGLRGWLVWHADLLSAMLDADQEIRTRYAAWVTEGDVLTAALSLFKKPSVTSVVPLALRRDLRKDRDIRRKDAGQIANNRIYLEDVFVDLPLETREFARQHTPPLDDDDAISPEIDGTAAREPEEIADDRLAQPAGVLAQLIERSADKLDPESIRQRKRRSRPARNRIVLLGGPGQGKSTIAQFLAQVSRARVTVEALRNEPPDTALEAADAILSRAEQEGINLCGPARFPMHVELPKFADAIKLAADRGEKLSLLRHCSNLLGRESDQALNPSDLRGWLGEYPWLVILDGLDEVPATGNRSDVVLAVNEFLDDVNQARADMLIVITTRPQGYGDDFPRRHWEHWTMANLAPKDAMRFAMRLADVLLSDGSRRDEILAELRRASEDPATAPILISPLQVSILFSLVETRGGVPADRWSLFQRHYVLLRDREAAKEGETARLLRDYTSQIDQIHYDAGFLLHVRAEASGTAHAFLSETEFELLIDRQLASEGHSRERIEQVKRRLVTIATDRLVLLGSKTGGQIAFDVRSLQEFMAAARLMSSPEAAIVDRLNEIAARTHWRHVFRIAASKVFALTDLTHLRRQIIHICDALDRGDLGASDMVSLSGARLAIDLLTDNVAARLPDMRRALVTRALDLLILGPRTERRSNLARFLDDDTKQTFEAKLVEHLSYDHSDRSRAAVGLLFSLANKNNRFSSWAMELLLRYWPSDSAKIMELVEEARTFPDLPELRQRIFEAQITTSPEASIHLILAEVGPEPFSQSQLFEFTPAFDWLAYFIEPEDGEQIVRVAAPNGEPLFASSIRLVSAGQDLDIPQWLNRHPKWAVLLRVAEFTKTPSKDKLAAVCREISDGAELHWLRELSLSWPIELVLGGISDGVGFEVAADRIERGAFGDVADWLKLEQRWVNDGVAYSAVEAWARAPQDRFGLLESPDVRRHASMDEVPEDVVEPIIHLFDSSSSVAKSNWFCQRLTYLLRRKALSNESKSLVFDRLLNDAAMERIADNQFVFVARMAINAGRAQSSILKKLNDIGAAQGLTISTDGATRAFLQTFVKNRDLRGLIPFLIPLSRNLTKQAAESLEEIPADALLPHASDSPMISAATVMIRVIRGLELAEGMSLALSSLTKALQVRPFRIYQFSRMVQISPWLSSEAAIAFLTMLCESLSASNRSYVSDVIEVLKSKLDARSSKLNDGVTTDKLALPSLTWLENPSARRETLTLTHR